METQLHTAFSNNCFRKVGILIDLGVNPNAQDQNGLTILMRCCYVNDYKERLALVMPLLEKSADLEVTDNSGRTALFHAVMNNRIRMTKLLSDEADIDLNKKDNAGLTILHIASDKGFYKIVRQLVSVFRKYHINIDVADNDGMTALHTACIQGHYDIARTLVYGGNASLSMRENKHFLSPRELLASALHLAPNFDPFPEAPLLRKKWAMSSVNMLQTIQERNNPKTAPASQVRVLSNKIRTNLGENHIRTKHRCKSAQIIRNVYHETSTARSKTTLLGQNTKYVPPKKDKNEQLTGRYDLDKASKYRIKSAPSKIQSSTVIEQGKTKSPMISCKLNDESLLYSPRPISKDRIKLVDGTFFQTSTFQTLYELYSIQSTQSYRPPARVPSPEIVVDEHDESKISRCSTGRRSVSSKARIQRVLQKHKAESLLKSLKGLHPRQMSSPVSSPRERRISTSSVRKQSKSDPGTNTGSNHHHLEVHSPKGRRPSGGANKAGLMLDLDYIRVSKIDSEKKSNRRHSIRVSDVHLGEDHPVE